ncbi:DUF4426 domain-containing protein [Chromatiaceae bacterium AAb-1]|nr:DUF4426 domain-containing protein [Chromatiaceae bacterium AAb-1]
MKSVFIIFLSLLLIAASPLQAEQKKQLGNWDVHYIAFNATFVTPDIARNYGLVRSKYNAIINISVLDSNSQQAQKASITGTARNLLGQQRVLEFKEVSEGNAIYYLATLPFRDQETYTFAIDIRQGNTIQTLNFKQTFYAE